MHILLKDKLKANFWLRGYRHKFEWPWISGMWSLQIRRPQLCRSLQAREFAKELQSSTVVKQTITASLDRLDSGKNLQSPKESPSGGSTVSEAYARMLRTFIPYLVDEVIRSAKFQADDFWSNLVLDFIQWILRIFLNFSLQRFKFLDSTFSLQSSFFASFMCFEVQPLTPQEDPADDDNNVEEETRAVNMDVIIPDTRKRSLPHVHSFDKFSIALLLRL